ncbi:MAG: D-alanine--D-alanine ligase [Elusimicrobiota bacterium]
MLKLVIMEAVAAEELKSKRIAVLMGGRSRERDVSLRSGKNVFVSLVGQGYRAVEIDPGEGDLVHKLKENKIDLAYIVLHGKQGEDGVIQGLLEHYAIPYTGSKVLASALAMNKVAAKQIWQAQGIPTAPYSLIDKNFIDNDIKRIKEIFPFPLMLKPISEGSSLGVSKISRPEEFEDKVRETLAEYDRLFVEQFINGTEITVGILGKNNPGTLPILELVPGNEFYDYEAKYTKGLTQFVLPARLPEKIYQKAQEVALFAHKALGCYGVSRVDMIVSKDGIPFVTEINTIPGMTETSDLPAQARHSGIHFDELVSMILASAY